MSTIEHYSTCNNCICLPVCKSKHNVKLIDDCYIIKSTIQKASKYLGVSKEMTLVFSGLERGIKVKAGTMSLMIIHDCSPNDDELVEAYLDYEDFGFVPYKDLRVSL